MTNVIDMTLRELQEMKEKAEKYDNIKHAINIKVSSVNEHISQIHSLLQEINPDIKHIKVSIGNNKYYKKSGTKNQHRLNEVLIYLRENPSDRLILKQISGMLNVSVINLQNNLSDRLKESPFVSYSNDATNYNTLTFFLKQNIDIEKLNRITLTEKIQHDERKIGVVDEEKQEEIKELVQSMPKKHSYMG